MNGVNTFSSVGDKLLDPPGYQNLTVSSTPSIGEATPELSTLQTLLFPITAITATVGSRVLANYLDPYVGQEHRSLWRRFVSVILPDNAPLSLCYFLSQMQDSSVMTMPSYWMGLGVMVLGTSVLLDGGRRLVAQAARHFQVIPLKVLSSFVAPRDLSAMEEHY